jgi:hypothetical protein
MNALAFAWRSLVRQPARATLGILGVAAVGALLFDMLLLSQGLIVSMRDLLDRSGFDVRVTATEDLLGRRTEIPDAANTAARFAMLPTVGSAITLWFESAELERVGGAGDQVDVSLLGAGGGSVRPWTVLRGRDVRGDRELVLNDYAARALGAEPGASVVVRASCVAQAPPPVVFHVAAVAEFPFDTPEAAGAATTAASLAEACGEADARRANLLLVASRGDPVATVADITRARPELSAITNEDVVGRLQAVGFTYFTQISTVLTTITVSFALLLITVLLTVSVNQRLGEIAALRALGFSRRRVAADVLCESGLIVGIGGVLSLPLGALLATGLDAILKRMPGIPTELHFFVFEPRALEIHAALLTATAFAAALYPMRIVAGLPIAATLRSEVI